MAELTLEQFNAAIAKLATKDDITIVRTELKNGLDALQKNLENYTDEVTASVLDSIDTNFQQVRRRLDMRDHRLNKVDSELQELKTALSISS